MAAPIIPDTWAVPERFRQRIGTKAGRQRAMVDAGHLLLVLHALPNPGDQEREPRVFWRAPGGEWKGTGVKGNGLAALKAHIEEFREAVHDLDEKIDAAASASELFHVLRAGTPIARSARNLHRAMQEAREGVDDKEVISLRDSAGEVERSADLALVDAHNALEYLETRAAEEQTKLAVKAAEAQHRLNLIAALFFPITALGSLLGTTLHSGLENQPPWVFWTMFVSAFAVGFLVRRGVTQERVHGGS
jgi:hypothetical protein